MLDKQGVKIMQLDRDVYYGWEILSFLSSFPDESWTHADISAAVILNREIKDFLRAVNPKTPVEEVRKKLEFVRDSVDGLDYEVRTIAGIVRTLESRGLVKRSRGFRITDGGKMASLLQVIEILGRPLKVADCVAGGDGVLMFDCPKRHSGSCYSHEVYCRLHKQLEYLLSEITVETMLKEPSGLSQ